ncbi:MAG: MMPL family transporter [Candidatus Methanomethylophilaceae archaeon]|nr:MMPL family transporter [Candidatus Methanomethylophilaceae archaeon]
MFAKTADFILKHSKVIIAIWIVLLACALPFGLKAGEVMQYDITQMSGVETEATAGMLIVNEEFSNTIDLSEILVISYNNADELTQAKAVFAKFSSLMTEKYDKTLTASYYGEYSKNNDGKGICLIAIACNEEKYDVTHQTANIRDLVSQAKTSVGSTLTTYVTGNAAIAYDTEVSSMQDVSKVDPISIALIFVLLGLFFFALVTAMVPPAVVGMAYGIALSAVFGIGCILDVYYVTELLVLVTMLGAGCDYALFIISRYRDELRDGASHKDALSTSIQWAGESVFTSGLAVIIGFGALSICSFSMVRSMGIILAIGILIALIAALTFIPSLINLIGERIFWPSNIETYRAVKDGSKKGFYAAICGISRRYFAWLSHVTHKYAIPIVIAWIVISVPAAYVFLTTNDSSDMISIMPSSEAVDGLNTIMTQTDGGTIMPTYVVIELKESAVKSAGSVEVSGNTLPYLIWTDTAKAATVPAIMKLSGDIKANHSDIVGTASGLNSWGIIYNQVKAALEQKGVVDPTPLQINTVAVSQLPSAVKAPIEQLMASGLYAVPCTQVIGADGSTFVSVENVIDAILNVKTGILSDNGKYVNMMVITTEKPMSDGTMAFLNELSKEFHGENGYDATYSALFAKTYVSGTSAVMNDISGEVEKQFSVIRIVVIALLIVLLFVILGSYLTPIRSMLTIVMTIIWTIALTRFTFGTVMSVPVLWLVPIVLFVVLLGLGMDYDIFLTTRIKENKVNGMPNGDAITDAVKKAGPVTSLCSLIMGGTFLTMLFTNSSLLQEFGFALGVGILIEGLFTVGFVVPAMMHLMGDWSWKGPKFLRRE